MQITRAGSEAAAKVLSSRTQVPVESLYRSALLQSVVTALKPINTVMRHQEFNDSIKSPISYDVETV